MPSVPSTTTQTSHALLIETTGGSQAGKVTVGAVNEWSPTQSMAATHVYQFGHGILDGVTGPYGEDFGTPYETVPGNITGMTIRASRYDLFPAQMENAWGTTDLAMLSKDTGMTGNAATGHLDLSERWFAPDNQQPYRWQYRGCWFTEIGRTLSTTNDRIVNVNATITYTARRRVIG